MSGPKWRTIKDFWMEEDLTLKAETPRDTKTLMIWNHHSWKIYVVLSHCKRKFIIHPFSSACPRQQQGHLELGQPSDTFTPVCPGASLGSPPGTICMEHLPREASRWLPIHEHTQLVPLDVESRLNSDGWMDFFSVFLLFLWWINHQQSIFRPQLTMPQDKFTKSRKAGAIA